MKFGTAFIALAVMSVLGAAPATAQKRMTTADMVNGLQGVENAPRVNAALLRKLALDGMQDPNGEAASIGRRCPSNSAVSRSSQSRSSST